ncbi:MAG TPA: DEAD/DEAH box helicase [Longimicrobiaceae bacterium]|nr:DEAD/DEAH box helicase [Longimicrobiaceae bacterium]
MSAPLRQRLRDALLVPPGEGASFLADPVFEAIFDWRKGDETMFQLAERGLLSADLVQAMATPSAHPELRDYVVPADRKPFLHQGEAWRRLSGPEAHSVVVTSGTGSGKTECFLVPILDQLARERRAEGRLRGVRALFLYPLNALINSQRDRLRAWCEPFGGEVRFCLYKGDTPKVAKATEKAAAREQVLDRKTLREDPPPILVTNSTMLEYMLIRAEDQQIIEQSRGQLRWIVLDEAHTYLGSQAAEMALLLRRVLHSFGVAARDVRFVATSATIGDDSPESAARLRDFLADLAGVDPNRVSVVRGHREVPVLPDGCRDRDEALPPIEVLREMQPPARFEALASSAAIRRMREQLLERQALTVSLLTQARLGQADTAPRPTAEERSRTLELVNLCTGAEWDDEPLLRVRAHLFHRTQAGGWACLNPGCAGRAGTALDHPDWAFGTLFFERRERCDRCGSLVLDLVLCDECGAEYLTADVVSDEGVRRYVPRNLGDVSEADEYSELIETDDEAQETAPAGDRWPRLLAAAGTPRTRSVAIGLVDGVAGPGERTAALGELFSESAGSHALRCARCGRLEDAPGKVFRDARRGAPFFLRSIIPLLIDYTPPLPEKERRLPASGRRLITFTDSRQGTARFALDAQLDAERNYVRGLIYHLLAAQRRDREATLGDEQELANIVAALELIVAQNPILQPTLDDARRKLEEKRKPSLGTLTWREAADRLAEQDEVRTWMRRHWRNLPLAELEPPEVAQLVLLREFLRRPKRHNSLETLGFVAVEYPGLRARSRPPVPWQTRGLPADEWLAFLKTALDFTVRGSSAVDVDRRFLYWLGVPVRPKVLVGPGAERGPETTVRWPTVSPSAQRNRLVQLLARVLDVSPADHEGAAEIDQCLHAAWDQVLPLLRTTQNGSILSLEQQVTLREVGEAWLCPVTRRILDTAVCGVTPYVSPDLAGAAALCRRIRMPAVPAAFWRRPDGSTFGRAEIERWTEESTEIRELEREGAWSDLSERILAQSSYFQVAEHSAQQSAERLRQLEGDFREGRLNVLSCSTTMEMGVDIGGLSGVAMNNTPPSPANYRQRAGRAGRRREARAFTLTLCKNTPHGEWIFRSPLWAFLSPAGINEVTLTSERIVQRHVNSLALTRFLAARAGGGALSKLEAGTFFPPPASGAGSVCENFERWLVDEAAEDTWVAVGIRRLLRRSSLDGTEPLRLLVTTADAIRGVREAWMAELEPLEHDLERLADSPEDRLARRAVELRLVRMRGEYLLRELALRNFLPGYGFPTQVVPFVTTTAEELERRRRVPDPEEARIDNLALAQGYPSRDLSIALRDYAPGASVVLDGRVLEVHGLTLNW